uniref:Uncharacterized protein n=1 Tax=viral metagenome TaxID=1070528 RepID=A0A6C0JIK2_9ZZZZ
MASGTGSTEIAFKGGNVLPLESPSSLTGNIAKYESVGGKRRSKKTKKTGQKGQCGGSALAFSELSQQKPLLAPIHNAGTESHKQAGGKRRTSSKKRRGSRKTMKKMMSGLFKLFKK